MRHLVHRRRQLLGDEAGLSLVETMAAIVVFGLVAVAATGLLITGIKSSKDQRSRAAAASVGAQQLEVDRHTSTTAFTSLTPPGSASFVYTVQGVNYTVTRTTAWEPKVDAAGACNASANAQGGDSGVQPVLEVTESVRWDGMGNDKPIVNQTALTPPVGTYTGSTGAIDVSLNDSGNSPLAGFPVTLTPTSGAPMTLTTDSRGCAFAAFLPAGTSYAVTVTQAGYVDQNENTTAVSTCEPSGTVTVTSGQVVSCPFLYDKAVTVNWAYQSGCNYGAGTGVVKTLAQCPKAGNVTTASVGNPGLSAANNTPGTFTPVATGSTLLYPYSSYSIWAGHCSTSMPLSPPANFTAKPSPVTPNPVTVPLYGLQLTMTASAPLPTISSIVAKEVVGGSNSCYPTAGGGTSYTLPVPAVTSSMTVLAGVPAGTYQVTVNYTKSGTAKTANSSTFTVTYNGSSAPNTGGTTSLTLS